MCETIFSLEVSPEVDKPHGDFPGCCPSAFCFKGVTNRPDWAAGSGSSDQASVVTAAVGTAGRALEIRWLDGKCLHMVTRVQLCYY